MLQEYRDFLKTKITLAPQSGFEVERSAIHPALFRHQPDCVVWALRGGRRALFEDFGLGKTVQQLEVCRQAVMHVTGWAGTAEDPFTGGLGSQALVILPLGVRQEFVNDAQNLLGLDAPRYVTRMADAERHTDAPILLTNAERVRDGDVDPGYFACCTIDEAACLRDDSSKNFHVMGAKLARAPYLFLATATPDPNQYTELLNHAHILGIMDRGQAKTRFFKRDSAKADNLTLLPGKEQEFWLWVSSWALFLSKPSDLGCSDEGYDLPPLTVRWHEVSAQCVPVEAPDGQLMLERDVVGDIRAAAAERRESVAIRVAAAKEIVDSDPGAHFILWHDREDERKEILQQLPGASDIYGNLDLEERERRTAAFAAGGTRLFATKKSLSGSGCNFQRHCHRAIFVGVDHKFNDFIQAIHRIYRFLQKEPVQVDVIHTETERHIVASLKAKWRRHDEQRAALGAIIREYGLDAKKSAANLGRSMGVERVEIRGNRYRLINNDCVVETAAMPEDSVDLMVTSVPFGTQYEYVASYNDFGHNLDNEAFFAQMDYLTPEKLRVLKPGRVCCVHVKDRIAFGNWTGLGFPTVDPFSDDVVAHYKRHGFAYMGRITVVTDVVRENNQTYRLGWTEQCKDGTKMGNGLPEYVLLFRKPPTDRGDGYADEPVVKSKEEYTRARWQLDAHGLYRSSGNRILSGEELAQLEEGSLMKAYRIQSRGSVYNYRQHVALCETLEDKEKLSSSFMTAPPASWHPEVWDDIVRIRTLNTSQSRKKQRMHVCPLQLDIAERLIERYSGPSDVVYDEFCGIGTVPYMAVKMGRQGLGCELSTDYFRDAAGYLEAAEAEVEQPTLFDFAEGAV